MSSKGKGKGVKLPNKAKSIGIGKRHRKFYHDNKISKAAVRRLARRGGVKRISGLVYDETNEMLKVFLKSIIEDAVVYAEHSRRKTLTHKDVIYALKRQGKTLYGFGGVSHTD